LILGFESAFSNGGDTLKILSYNIFMIPPPIFKSAQKERAAALGALLKSSDADVIVFQEAFMKKARNIIYEQLANVYPYHTGKPRGGGVFRFNSGVWIVSKYPLEDETFIRYKEKKGYDARSGKGALMVKVKHPNLDFYLIGTHVQADDQQLIRYAQFEQIVKEIYPQVPVRVPKMIVGDLNTNLYEIDRYAKMLDILNMEDCDLITDEKYTHDGTRNDLSKKFFKSDHKARLDYILWDKHPVWDCVGSEIKILRSDKALKGKFFDLSDHYAIFSKFILKQ
jgi:endonuclease/exonuclease/phosphatase family metal-dependent hydrolase